jgi:putative oxidoreductase
MKSTTIFIEAVKFLLILLFVYAAASKLLDPDRSRGQMMNQVFPAWVAGILVWAVPLAELITAGLLVFNRTALSGLYMALGLMSAFTIYIALVLLHVFGRVPCSCGGVLQKMGWVPHLFFNLFFLLLTVTGIYMVYRERRGVGKKI